MKSYDETAKSVIEKANKYIDIRENRIRTLRRASVSAACMIFVFVICIGIWQTGSGNKSHNVPADNVLGTNNNEGEKEIVLPPTRYGKGISKASLAKGYTFESAFEDSDMVAIVRIGNWLGEKETSRITYFEADIIDIYKGEEIDNIVLYQDGNADSTLKGYPLFTYGNEILVFLNHITDPKFGDAYWIIGSYTTVFDVITTDSGDVYFSDRWGVLAQTMDTCTNYAMQPGVRADVYLAATKNDPVFFDDIRRIRFVFSESDVEALIDSLK